MKYENPDWKEMVRELEGMEHAVTSEEATFLQAFKGMVDRDLYPSKVQMTRLSMVYKKYVDEFDTEAQIDL